MRRFLARTAFALAVAFSPVLPAAGEGDGRFPTDVDPAEAARILERHAGEPDFVLLDVRTPGEYASGHIEGALLLDFTAKSFREELGRLDRDDTYLVYCRTANRSREAVNIMREMGFRNVYHMTGGMVQWTGEGRPTAR